MLTLLLVIGALVMGVVIGVLAGRQLRRPSPPPVVIEAIASTPPPPEPVPQPAEHSDPWPERSDVLDRLAVGVVLVSPRGKAIYRNPAATSLAGTHSGLLIDDTVDKLVRLALQGTTEHRTLELYGPPRLAITVSAHPLDGGGALATITDESEKRRVDAVRTDFVANISHELRTPVGALAVLAETLIGETDASTIDRMANRMVEEAHRVSRTIDDLLELSRIELGEEPIRDTVPATDVIAGAVERGEEFARQREIDVVALGIPEGLSVIGDRRQLVSALGNIVENAVKYSEPGSNVQVRVRRTGEFAEFMVADNGIGIPARDHDRIFERFYRVDRARSRDTGGTGLGLSIVRHVADNHGGSVEVSSQEGEGSTFVLRIPSAAKLSTENNEVMSS